MSLSPITGFKPFSLHIDQLCLASVLKCGQSFRWSKLSTPVQASTCLTATSGLDDVLLSFEYRHCIKDRVICLRQSNDTLFYRALFPDEENRASASYTSQAREAIRDEETLEFIREYFQLDIDLKTLYRDWAARDPVFERLQGRFGGIRMLRQDPWECLVSFICSSNNNIARITKMVENLCLHFSPPLKLPESLEDPELPTSHHAFPPPSALSDPSVSTKLRYLGFGYRADFIQKTAAMLLQAHGSDSGVYAFLTGLRRAETSVAREELVKLMGVGRKVADCVLLMSMDKPEVVPVDTHVHQIAVKHYGLSGKGKTNMSPKLYDEVNDRLVGVWGPYAGWAHSILFTSDLKAFANHGLPTPSPTPTPRTSPPVQTEFGLRASKLGKRQRKGREGKDLVEVKGEGIKLESETILAGEDGGIVDRVKRRRRTVVSSIVSIKAEV